MTNLIALKAANAKRWVDAKPTRNFATVARDLARPDAKARYQTVARQTDVPWAVIALIHEREAGQNWKAQLGQGDPLSEISTHIPVGRGPFPTWEEAALDALVSCPPYAARNKDWSIGGTLTKLEEFNGLGYAARGRPSPYIWSGTDQYISGKYVRDGVYDPDAVDGQLGCAGLLMAMMALDPTITFTGAVLTPSAGASPVPKPATPSVPKPPPSVNSPAKGSIGAAIATVFSAILSAFRRK